VILVELCERAFEGELAPRHLKLLHEIIGAGEQYASAVLDEREANGGRQVALSGAGRAEHEEIGALVDPVVAGS
jgi:hypothetical protein